MKLKAFASILAIIFLISLMGCGGSSSSTPPPSISVAFNPAPPTSLQVNATASLTAVVSNDSANAGVTWSVTCGSAGACGGVNPTSTASGAATTYTAPAAVPTGNTVKVTATSVTDTTKSASATITITVPPISVTFNPAPPTSLQINATASLTAVVSNDSANAGVTWSVTCGSAGACGGLNHTSTASGAATTYTAPAAVPTGNTVKVTATSVTDTTKSASATIIITAVASSNYSFYLTGTESVNDGPNFYALAGSVTIDANGNVLAGEQDYNDGTGVTATDTIQPETGALTWVDAATGQGTLTLTTTDTKVGVKGVETLGVQFVNTNHALIAQFDGSATSSGSMDLQTLPSTLSGGYAFTLSGVDTGYSPIVFGGVFSISGTNLQDGVVDVNDDGDVATETTFTGTISVPDSFGRGTITNSNIATTLAYYIVGPKAIRIIDVDTTGGSGVGSAFGQGTGTFSNASLGSSVFGVESNSFARSYAAAGMFTVPASGTFQGVADDNEEGVVVSAVSISGTYAIPASSTVCGSGYSGTAYNGYGCLTITSANLGDVSALGIYMTDPTLNLLDPNNTTSGLGGALVADMNATGSVIGTGVLIPQTDTSTASFTGNYAFGAQDYNDYKSSCSPCEFDFVGQGSVTSLALSGTGLVSDPYSFFSSTATDTGVGFSGTAVADTNNPGRYTITPAITVGAPVDFNVVIYQASGGQLLWLDEDSNDLFLGSLQQQGSLTGLPAAKKAAARSKLKQ